MVQQQDLDVGNYGINDELSKVLLVVRACRQYRRTCVF